VRPWSFVQTASIGLLATTATACTPLPSRLHAPSPRGETEGTLSSRGGELGDFDVPITACARDVGPGADAVELSDDAYATVVVDAWDGEAWEGLLPFDPNPTLAERARERDKRRMLTLRVSNLDPRVPRRDVYLNELSCDVFVGYARRGADGAVGGFRLSCATRGGGRIVGSVVYRC
jgi:hypothetical protein